MNESELNDALRDTMRDRAGTPAPDFEEVWAAAEQRYERARRRYTAVGGVAAAVAVIAIVAALRPGEPPPDDEFLIADALMNSTTWQAPSDALLPDYRDDIYGEIPVLMESTDLNEGSLL